MGLRFRKSVKIAPGVRLNVGKKSSGISVGGKGGGVSFNSKTGAHARASAPGTGLSYTTKLSGNKKGRSNTRSNSHYKKTDCEYNWTDDIYLDDQETFEPITFMCDERTLQSLNRDALAAYAQRVLDSSKYASDPDNNVSPEMVDAYSAELILIRAEIERRRAGGKVIVKKQNVYDKYSDKQLNFFSIFFLIMGIFIIALSALLLIVSPAALIGVVLGVVFLVYRRNFVKEKNRRNEKPRL